MRHTSCLGLHTLRTVHHDDGRVYGGERAVSVLTEILVTRCVEDVHLISLIVELHNRGRHRDTTLLLNVHPVRRGSLSYLVVLNCTCHLNLSSEEKEFLRERSLTGVRV